MHVSKTTQMRTDPELLCSNILVHACAYMLSSLRTSTTKIATRTLKHNCTHNIMHANKLTQVRAPPELLCACSSTLACGYACSQQCYSARTTRSSMRMLKRTCTPLRMHLSMYARMRADPELLCACSNTLARAQKHACCRAYAEARTTNIATRTLKHTCARLRMHLGRHPQMIAEPELRCARSKTLARA
jgi:hypothetical protein